MKKKKELQIFKPHYKAVIGISIGGFLIMMFIWLVTASNRPAVYSANEQLKSELPVQPYTEEKAKDFFKVNINTASIEEIASLPYIGNKKAVEIVRYREKNGEFKNARDLIRANLLDWQTFRKIQDKIKVSG